MMVFLTFTHQTTTGYVWKRKNRIENAKKSVRPSKTGQQVENIPILYFLVLTKIFIRCKSIIWGIFYKFVFLQSPPRQNGRVKRHVASTGFLPYKDFHFKSFFSFLCFGEFFLSRNFLVKSKCSSEMRLISRDGRRMERSGPAVEGIFQSVWLAFFLFIPFYFFTTTIKTISYFQRFCILPLSTFHSFSYCSHM